MCLSAHNLGTLRVRKRVINYLRTIAETERINSKSGISSFRNIAKEFGYQWKVKNNVMVLIEKHDVKTYASHLPTWKRPPWFHAQSSSCLQLWFCDQKFFNYNLQNYYYLTPVFFPWTVLPGGRRWNIIKLSRKWIPPNLPLYFRRNAMKWFVLEK
jgi:hypothetical protein